MCIHADHTDSMPTQHGRRGLQQGSTPVTVRNPEQLVEAISTGEIHIVLVEHLDLTGLDLRSNPACPEGEDGCGSPLPALRETQSIRVRPPAMRLCICNVMQICNSG